MAQRVVCVVGPTASGKTKMGVALAKRFNGEVVSVDSMQIYRRMDIGTAKPTAQERALLPHHMLDVADPTEAYAVAEAVTERVRVRGLDDVARDLIPIAAAHARVCTVDNGELCF